MTKNKYLVNAHVWRHWTEEQREAFNRGYEALIEDPIGKRKPRKK